MTSGGGYDDAGFVASSRYRAEVLEHLAESPAMPKAISDATGDDIAHISRALGELRDHGLVDLLVDEERKKGRIYGLTDAGEACLDRLDELGVTA